MAGLNNGSSHTNGYLAHSLPSTLRCPRRLVLLVDGEQSEPLQVLAEYQNGDVSGNRLHADLQRQAGEHPGRTIAAEWLGKLGWTRFVWCKK